MKTYLTNDQKKAFEKFSRLKVGALFMEQGTGKTRTALELINYNIKKIDIVIWFTPFSTISNLESEINKWNFDFKIIIMGWETLSSSDKKYLNLLEKIENKKVFIVADESIFIKNQETKRYQRLMNLSQKSEYRIILNGTPITKNEWDLYYQMKFLSPLIINMSENEFGYTFYKKITYKKAGQKENSFFKLSEVNIDYLHKLIDPYIYKCNFIFEQKETTDVKLIEPTKLTTDNYFELKDNSLDNLINFQSEEIIKLINSLAIVSASDLNKAKAIAKFVENRKCIVFYQYKNEAEQISKYLNDFLIINGDVKKNDRTQILNDFELNNIPLLISFGTGSYGLNLQHCNEIIFSSLTFDYAKILQAKARIKRIGQIDNIKYTYFDINLPINKFIAKNINKKEELATLIIDYLKEGQSEK